MAPPPGKRGSGKPRAGKSNTGGSRPGKPGGGKPAGGRPSGSKRPITAGGPPKRRPRPAAAGSKPATSGEPRGEPSAHLPPAAFVSCLQTHDQVGNRAFGERLDALADPALMPAALACLLLGPQVPMLFMGEEYAVSTPFLFFCDFGEGLADAVREGRRAEFARFPDFSDQESRARIPDPLADATAAASTLRWQELERDPHAAILEWHRRVLALRHAEIVPRLPRIRCGGIPRVIAESAVSVTWNLDGGGVLALDANLSPRHVGDFPAPRRRVLWEEGSEPTGAVKFT